MSCGGCSREVKCLRLRRRSAVYILLAQVFPKIRYTDYRRALCVLDPYRLQLKWEVLQAAAKEKTIEVFLNFPIMDMNKMYSAKEPQRKA